jgi:molecular chaperone DnaJ
MTDYYSVLGVNKNASEDEIKKAYRQLARETHPDKGGDKEQFQKIQEAYEVLSNSEKRRQYDNPQMTSQPSFPFDFFFQQATGLQRQAPPNRKHTIKVSLRDAYFGTIKKFKITREVSCLCNISCNQCGGNGFVHHQLQSGQFMQITTQQCNRCFGVGTMKGQSCDKCNEVGRITEDKLVELQLEKGFQNGKQFIIEGWGGQSNKQYSDLIIEVVIDNDPNFTRIDLDLLYTKKISLRDSIIGADIVIPHFDGDYIINLKGFGIINPNKQYTISNKGMKTNFGTGNLHLRFHIDYPERTFNKEEITILTNAFDKLHL